MNGAVHPVPFAQADAALAIAAIVLMIVGGFIGFVILWCWTQRELNDRWSPTKDDDLEMRETSALLITEVEPRSNPSPSMAAKRLRMDGVIITDEPRLTLRA